MESRARFLGGARKPHMTNLALKYFFLENSTLNFYPLPASSIRFFVGERQQLSSSVEINRWSPSSRISTAKCQSPLLVSFSFPLQALPFSCWKIFGPTRLLPLLH
ncbi:hypothetical protein CIPAW_02G034400 [Carya illinoinensis]|uniref:Uncharacterized protein n=1 Tax=Carya illinoinensis TaxID=32201 RepID=A0A8T1RBV7_CARIL|nr:hypothetical protein CIPAW_02G034400 [Carya illinoinensis]